MATKKSTPGARSPQFNSLHDHIELQRSRLMDAEAVLDCLIVAIDDDGRLQDPSAPSYPIVVRIAREFVHGAIGQLDSVNVRAAVERDVSAETLVGEGRYGGVKEAAAGYFH